MGFNPEEYEPVAARLDRWLDAKLFGYTNSTNDYPRVLTRMVSEPGADICVIRAELWLGENMIATGYAEEIRDTSGKRTVNATSHVENCETSAIGRALANCGMAGSDMTKRPSREEMNKVQRTSNGFVETSDNKDSLKGKPFEGTKIIANKFKTKCSVCGQMMEAGAGLATNSGAGWVNTHKEGECNAPVEEPF